MNYEIKQEEMTKPSKSVVRDIAKLDDDILILGAGGKIGLGLAITAARAQKAAETGKRTVAVSIFSSEKDVEELKKHGVEVINIDLSREPLPDKIAAINTIIYMIGRKFGTTGSEYDTWYTNVALPSYYFHNLKNKRAVVFSTGNVYSFSTLESGGSLETDLPEPVGEYAQSCLARERVFEYYAMNNNIASLIFRLNYAIDYRYGVLFDIAKYVLEKQPVPLEQGYFNCIWQGDVYEYALRSLLHCSVPAEPLNVTSNEIYSVKETAEWFAKRFNKEVHFSGKEKSKFLISNANKMVDLMGVPPTDHDTMLKRVAAWIEGKGDTIVAPTHFEAIDGKY
ncbi:MAG: NAD(P)-dependent oxidoreductase [Fastidiosipila sp.]|nr:NAD(P)-dependent oxidoreductase [Fastidiosipila sp.]